MKVKIFDTRTNQILFTKEATPEMIKERPQECRDWACANCPLGIAGEACTIGGIDGEVDYEYLNFVYEDEPWNEPKVRPNWPDLLMQFAQMLSQRSTCSRAKVGCVITSADFNQVFSIGYNGNYSGGPNQCDSSEAGKCGCLHAEENALLKLNVPRDIEKVLICTTVPCLACAKRIINKGGIKTIYYKEDYRLSEGKDLLLKVGIQVIKL